MATTPPPADATVSAIPTASARASALGSKRESGNGKRVCVQSQRLLLRFKAAGTRDESLAETGMWARPPSDVLRDPQSVRSASDGVTKTGAGVRWI
jgi:hypothetical protein